MDENVLVLVCVIVAGAAIFLLWMFYDLFRKHKEDECWDIARSQLHRADGCTNLAYNHLGDAELSTAERRQLALICITEAQACLVQATKSLDERPLLPHVKDTEVCEVYK